MKTPVLIIACAVVLLAAVNPAQAPVAAQKADDSLVRNPDLLLPPTRVKDDVQYSLRQARDREIEAIALERESKKDLAMDKWRDAMARYEALRREYLKPEDERNTELLVRAEWAGGKYVYSETWQPLADYINSRYRIADWPRPLRDQLSMRQAAPGAELLRNALADNNEQSLRRCARYYQFSESGRTALRLLAEQALERGDDVLAVRWLYELLASWPEYYARDPMLQVLYVRACRDAGMSYRLGAELRRREYEGAGGTVDVGGRQLESTQAVQELTSSEAPSERPELRGSGWPTLQGDGRRNGIAPPATGVGEIVDLDADDKVFGFKLTGAAVGGEEQRDPYGREQRPQVPVAFPAVHESGFFIHKVDDSQGAANPGPDEKLLWFRHGREASPVALEVPTGVRYGRSSAGNQYRGGWWGGNVVERDRYRILGSTIARVSWELDNRESDLLFAVMGPGYPAREKVNVATGNQIQAWDLTDDAKLRVTLPNPKVEKEEEKAFLQHVIFKGAPLVRNNRLYIAGAVPEKDSVEMWMFCFDVTPKGDAAAGEGKLQWRVHLCSQRQQNQNPWGSSSITVPEVSSVSEQGGMLYVSTHAGASAAVDRTSGELCWVSKYGRGAVSAGGWFCGPPIAAGGQLVTTPYDYGLALVLDTVWGTQMMEYPLFEKGPREDYQYVLGVVDNRMVIQGRARLYSVGLTDHRKGGVLHADQGKLKYQSTDFGAVPIGRGVIAGSRVLVPFRDNISIYDVNSGKLLTRAPITGVTVDKSPFTLTVYCRGEAYKDDQGLLRYKPVALADPDTGNVYNVEHLRNGEEFTFPSGKKAVVNKETFLILASAQWTYMFKAED